MTRPVPRGGALAFTGFPLVPFLALAVALLLVGTGLLAAARSRSRSDSAPRKERGMRKRWRHAIAATALVALVALGAAPVAAQSASTDVVVAAIAGSRTLSVTTPAGASLDGGQLDLGAARKGGFAVNVLDVLYDHVGYDVSATLSNLYLFDGSFDCAKKVVSGDLSTAFPVDATASDVSAAAQGLVDLAGTVNSSVASALDPLGSVEALLAPLGLSLVGQPIAIDDIATEATDSIAGILDGLDSRLPVRVSAGAPGAFSSAAAHGACGEGSGSPTQRQLMSGDASSVGSLVTGILSDLETAVNGATGSTLVSGGVIDEAAAQAGAAAAIQALHDSLETLAGISLPPLATDATAINAVLGLVTGAVDSIDVAGQTGTYLSIPVLEAAPDSAPQTGVYRGTMTVTLVDTP